MNTPRRNLLIGQGERLIHDGTWATGKSNKPDPYTIEQQRSIFSPVLEGLAEYARAQPPHLAPRQEVAAKLTIHPQFLAKSYFPSSLLQNTGLRLIGSRSAEVTPRRMVREKPPIEMPTATLIVAGTSDNFLKANRLLQSPTLSKVMQGDFSRLERIEPFLAGDRKRGLDLAHFDGWAETVLHASFEDKDVLRAFHKVVTESGADTDLDRARTIGGLTFLPLHVPVDIALEFVRAVEEFTHLRAIRNMPFLSQDPVDIDESVSRSLAFAPPLPDGPADDEATRAVIFDGGFTPGLLPWVSASDAPGVPSPASSSTSPRF